MSILKNLKKKSDILHISDNIDYGFALEPPPRGGSNANSNLCFWAEIRKKKGKFHLQKLSRNKKNNVYPWKSQFYYIKVGFKGVKII